MCRWTVRSSPHPETDVAVYVDPNFEWPKSRKWPYGSVSHMYADTPSELHAFAARIGLKRAWASDKTQPGSQLLHYDLSPAKREQAVRMGAVAVDHRHKFQFYPARARRWLEDAGDAGDDADGNSQAERGHGAARPRAD